MLKTTKNIYPADGSFFCIKSLPDFSWDPSQNGHRCQVLDVKKEGVSTAEKKFNGIPALKTLLDISLKRNCKLPGQ